MAEPGARRLARLVSVPGAGVLAALGQAPIGLWPATLAGLALGYLLWVTAPGARAAALRGWGFGTGYFGLTLIWIVQPFLVDPETYGWMAPFGLIFMAGGMALFWAAGFVLARWIAPGMAPGGRFGWAGWAIGMGAMEFARGNVMTGFPWGGPGQVWIDTGLAQLAAFVGAWGLNVASFALAGLLGAALLGRRVAPALVVLGALALGWGAGAWIAAQPLPPRAEPVTIRLIQPNATQHLKWDRDWVWTWFDRARALSAQPATGDAPDLVVWPETSIATLLGDVPQVQAEAAVAAAPAPLIAGIERLDGRRLYNSLVLFGPDGAAQEIYDKHHIVPFGEYIPLGGLLSRFGIHGLASDEGGGFSRGQGAALLPLPGALGEVLPLICYEAIFPRDLRAAPGRADWILQITNDGWFGTFSGPQQHLVQARFRAIEFGLPFARAANTGVSAMIDPRGRVVASLPLGEAGALDAALPAALPPSVYARFGDTPLGMLLIVASMALVLMRRVKPIDPTGTGR